MFANSVVPARFASVESDMEPRLRRCPRVSIKRILIRKKSSKRLASRTGHGQHLVLKCALTDHPGKSERKCTDLDLFRIVLSGSLRFFGEQQILECIPGHVPDKTRCYREQYQTWKAALRVGLLRVGRWWANGARSETSKTVGCWAGIWM